ncbi:MAG TPA: hypothetical protein VFC19_30785 [Candidatus Limnocylindrales bacterium]|nr:hypothetical protein [Candidatus Limnocylindrales bacterium]
MIGFGVKCRLVRYAAVLATAVLSVGAMLAVTSPAAAQARQRPPSPAALASALWAVSCTSASACTAVGHYYGSTGASVALAERWNGTAWTVQSTPNPGGASYFNGVSCTSASACTAVGHYHGSTGATVTLAERWNGTAWTVQPTPNPSGATASFLNAVSCSSVSACTAVGYYLTSTGATVTLAQRWDGTTWTLQPTPNPSGATASYLLGVSCTAASACTATGFSTTSTGATVTLAQRWDGTSWAVQPTPNPSGATASQLYGVSCASASACTAVGNYVTSTGATVTLAQRWDGTTWTVQPTPHPSDATASYLNGVSCISVSACISVGWYQTSPGVYETLAQRWDGTTWTVQSTPNPSGATASYLFGVSCASASACAAAGYTLNPNYTAMAERWDGTTWTVQSTPNP